MDGRESERDRSRIRVVKYNTSLNNIEGMYLDFLCVEERNNREVWRFKASINAQCIINEEFGVV
jgi:hypothetical protein